MNKVTDIDSKRPHDVFQMTCEHCSHVWTAVFPETTRELERPRCGKMTSLYQDPADYKSMYFELIMEVQQKVPGESRFETAKRLIRDAENQDNPPAGG